MSASSWGCYRRSPEEEHVPATINKYYVRDLAPGLSTVEYLVASGQQGFVISWRNPGEAQGYFDLDTYADAVLQAHQAVVAITSQSAVHLNAACSGGITTAWVPPSDVHSRAMGVHAHPSASSATD